MSDPEETILAGGNTNTVVRVGPTVRRLQNRHSATHHRLLQHLAAQGFAQAPRVMGIDNKNREILSFIEGDTAFPEDLWTSDQALETAADMLRRLHAATDTFDTTDATWAQNNTPAEVICHNDFAPYNMIFRDGVPVAIIDFDVCGPGPRLRDLAYLAYWFVPLSFAAHDLRPLTQKQAAQGFPRLRKLCDIYGSDNLEDLLIWVSRSLHQLADFTAMADIFDATTAQKLHAEGHLAHWQREAEAFDAALPDVIVALA